MLTIWYAILESIPHEDRHCKHYIVSSHFFCKQRISFVCPLEFFLCSGFQQLSHQVECDCLRLQLGTFSQPFLGQNMVTKWQDMLLRLSFCSLTEEWYHVQGSILHGHSPVPHQQHLLQEGSTIFFLSP